MNSENDLLAIIKNKYEQSPQVCPDKAQDDVFEENLDAYLSDNQKGQYWTRTWKFAAAAVFVVSLAGLAYINGYFNNSHSAISISQLIVQSNKLEQSISDYDDSLLSPEQFIEVLKLKEKLDQLDRELNSMYSARSNTTNEKIRSVWAKKVELTNELQALYTQNYIVARI